MLFDISTQLEDSSSSFLHFMDLMRDMLVKNEISPEMIAIKRHIVRRITENLATPASKTLTMTLDTIHNIALFKNKNNELIDIASFIFEERSLHFAIEVLLLSMKDIMMSHKFENFQIGDNINTIKCCFIIEAFGDISTLLTFLILLYGRMITNNTELHGSKLRLPVTNSHKYMNDKDLNIFVRKRVCNALHLTGSICCFRE